MSHLLILPAQHQQRDMVHQERDLVCHSSWSWRTLIPLSLCCFSANLVLLFWCNFGVWCFYRVVFGAVPMLFWWFCWCKSNVVLEVILMLLFWCNFNAVLILFWSKFSAVLVHFWCYFDTFLVKYWSCVEELLVQLSCSSGANLLQF